MIKIEHSNLDKISIDYFNSIKQYCVDRASFFLSVYNVIFNNANVNDIINDRSINGKTKVRCVNNFLRYNKLRGQTQYANVTIQNIYPWVNTQRQVILDLINYLSDVNNLKAIILAPASQTLSVDSNLINHFGLTNNVNKKELFNFICLILSYEDFHKRVAYDTAANLGINTCPYCNRIYINTILDGKNGVIRPSFDHFFPHSKHPFLALSFYNLIPSCYYCNSSLKSSRSISYDTHIHPFIEGYDDDCVFRIIIAALNPEKSDPRNYKVILQSKIDQIDPKYRKIFGLIKSEGSNNLFRLQEIYNAHTDIVGELIVKADRYSKAHSDSLYGLFGLLKTNKKEFYQYYFGNYYIDKDHSRRPMAKLTKNILQQIIPDFFKD
jgi:hypothetical protein